MAKMKFTVNQKYIDANPDFVANGGKLGDEIKIEKSEADLYGEKPDPEDQKPNANKEAGAATPGEDASNDQGAGGESVAGKENVKTESGDGEQKPKDEMNISEPPIQPEKTERELRMEKWREVNDTLEKKYGKNYVIAVHPKRPGGQPKIFTEGSWRQMAPTYFGYQPVALEVPEENE